jgi:hypothetical protein
MNHTTVSLEELFFYIYFIIMTVAKGLGLVDGMIYKACLLTAMFFVILKLLVGKYSIAEYVIIASLLLMCLYIWHVTGNMSFFICVTLVVSLKNVPVRRVFNVGAFVWTFAFMIQVITQLLNLRARDFVIHNKYHLGYVIRWALGYSHPNVLQISYAILVMYLFYVFRPEGRKLVKYILISFAGACYIFMYSLSATGMLMYLMFVFFLVCFEYAGKHKGKRNRTSIILLNMIFPLAAGISVLGPVILSGRAFDIVNRLMTTRLELSKRFYTDYGISLFGQNFSKLPAVLTLDCSYTRLLMYGGLILFIIMCVGYILMINDALKEKCSVENSIKLAIIFSTIIAGMSEPFLFNESFKNLTLIFLGEWMFSKGLKWAQKGAQYHMLRFRMQNVDIPNIINRDRVTVAHEQMKNKRTSIIVVILICGSIGTAVYCGTVSLPNEVYALRVSCDTDDNSKNVYLTESEAEELRSSGEAWILNYKDEKTPLLCFTGSTIHAEYVRGIVSSFAWSVLAVYVIMVLFYSFDHKRCI